MTYAAGLLHHSPLRPENLDVAQAKVGFNQGALWMVLLQIKDFRLTTAEILYRMPDHPALLQSYVWQNMDLAPEYPALKKFLDFWEANLDGKLHSIRIAAGHSVRQAAVRHATHLKSIH